MSKINFILKWLTLPIWGTVLLVMALIWIFSPLTEREKLEAKVWQERKNEEDNNE